MWWQNTPQLCKKLSYSKNLDGFGDSIMRIVRRTDGSDYTKELGIYVRGW